LFVTAENFLTLSHQTLTSSFSKWLGTHKGTFRNEATICPTKRSELHCTHVLLLVCDAVITGHNNV